MSKTLAKVTPLTSTTIAARHATIAIASKGVTQMQSSAVGNEGAAQGQSSSFRVVTYKSVCDLNYSESTITQV